jgi:hypothetical protein
MLVMISAEEAPCDRPLVVRRRRHGLLYGIGAVVSLLAIVIGLIIAPNLILVTLFGMVNEYPLALLLSIALFALYIVITDQWQKRMLCPFVNEEGKVGYVLRASGKLAIEPAYDVACYFSEGRAAVLVDGKWGFIDRKGRTVIAPVFDNAMLFRYGRAAVMQGEKWGFIGRKGHFIIGPTFEQVESFQEKRAAVKMNGKWGFISLEGRYIVTPQMENAWGYSGGLADVRHNGVNVCLDRKGRIIRNTDQYKHGIFPLLTLREATYLGPDTFAASRYLHPSSEFYRGKEVGEAHKYLYLYGYSNPHRGCSIRPQFTGAGPFVDERAVVKIGGRSAGIGQEAGEGKWGFIDSRGAFIFNRFYGCALGYSEGLAAVQIGRKWGFISREGTLAIEPRFDDVLRGNTFRDGLAAVSIGNKWGFIDTRGVFAVEPRLDITYDARGAGVLVRPSLDQPWNLPETTIKEW